MRFLVYPYKMTSQSAKHLAKELDCKRIYADREYTPKDGDIIINWGNGNKPAWAGGPSHIINHWDNICMAINKKITFAKMKAAGVSIPDVTVNQTTAKEWLSDGHFVVGRQYLEGTRGEGIVLMKQLQDFTECRLYTKYYKKMQEFRTYTFGNRMIDILEKRRDTDMLAEGKVDEFIRTEENGWVFCRHGIRVPTQEIELQSVKAVKSLGLLFGGVDIIYNPYSGKAIVLEVNTAPGIFGTTVPLYGSAIRKYAKEVTRW